MNKHPLAYAIACTILFACGAQQPTDHVSSNEQQTVDQPTRTDAVVAVEEKEQDLYSELADSIAVQSPALSQKIVPMLEKRQSGSVVHESMRVAGHTIIIEPPILDENRENYDPADISKIQLVSQNPVSTFSTDVDTASYTNARRFLQNGQLPPAESIRVEEFINYFDYQYTAPNTLEEPISIQTESMITPWNEETELLRVSLQAYRTDIDELPPLNLVFLLDVSGSMSSADKLPLMQRSFNLLVNKLRPQDHVSIVVYAGASGVVLEPTSGDNKTEILNAINQLQAGGSTHGSAGIHLAYEMAAKHYKKGSMNRVILGTDGDFNVGTTDITQLKTLIEEKRETGVFLNVLGFGTGNYNDALMEEISNHGNGNAYYIDGYQEARKIFGEQLTSTIQTVAKDVKIQVEFNPDQVEEYRLIGYDNRLLNREDFNNDKIDAGEMGAGHTVTALYEIVRTDSDFRFSDPLRYQQTEEKNGSKNSELAFVKVRYKQPNSKSSELMSIPVIANASTTPSRPMVLAASVAGFAENLRHSKYVNQWGYADAIKGIQASLDDDRWGYRQELLQLVRNANSLTTDSFDTTE